MKSDPVDSLHVAFIGSAGIPNRYGGFESFLEHCAPEIARRVTSCTVTCDATLYEDQSSDFLGVRRVFISTPANGASSIVHDLLAFLRVVRESTHIVVLGVSGGPWFPFFRFVCAISGKRLVINVDGIEWRRTKFGRLKRAVLRLFDLSAQCFAHTVVYDSSALQRFIASAFSAKAVQIAYSGDHVLHLKGISTIANTALTVCRIEPENNIHLLIEGFLKSNLSSYTIVGNWTNSSYGSSLRARYEDEPRLSMRDPIYDAVELGRLRQECAVYLHGHSVGGTNPSLVEVIFYDCGIICFDCSFNRATVGDSACYFSTIEELAANLDRPFHSGDRSALRHKYSKNVISSKYIEAMRRTP